MSYTIRQIDSSKDWQEFFNTNKVNSFLHTWQYGEFNTAINTRPGESVHRIGVYNDGGLVGIALFIVIQARRGSYVFCPHGPIVQDNNQTIVKNIIEYSIDFARQKKVDFVRYAPLLPNTSEFQALFSELGFRAAPIHVHPELAWILDITPSADDLLAQMRKTSRYSIRKAIKDGVNIRKSTTLEDLGKFENLYSETVARQHFTPFSTNYLENELKHFSTENSLCIYIAEYNNEPVAASMVIYTPYSGFYHQGASSRKYPKLTAAHLMQWEAILEAKRRGCQRYNFWGIIEDAQTNHPWKGLTLFKKGFGGYSENYLHAQDRPLTSKYWLNFAIETIRKKKRGY